MFSKMILQARDLWQADPEFLGRAHLRLKIRNICEDEAYGRWEIDALCWLYSECDNMERIKKMARPKKENHPISIRMDKAIYDRLNEFCEVSGQPKTVAIERAVMAYINDYLLNAQEKNHSKTFIDAIKK